MHKQSMQKNFLSLHSFQKSWRFLYKKYDQAIRVIIAYIQIKKYKMSIRYPIGAGGNLPTATYSNTTTYYPANTQATSSFRRVETRTYGSAKQQTPPTTSPILSKTEIQTPLKFDKSGESDIFIEFDRFAYAFLDYVSEEAVLKALNSISSTKALKFKENFRRIIQQFCTYKQSYLKQQSDSKIFEGISNILKSQQLCDPLNLSGPEALKEVARLWNDRKIIEDYANRIRLQSKAILSTYMTRTGLDILQKLQKREESNSRQSNPSINKTSSTTSYIERDIGEELEKILNGSYYRQNSKIRSYAPKVSEALEKFNRDLTDKLASQRREVKPSTSRNEDADLKDKMVRKILDIQRETSSIDELQWRRAYEKFPLSSLFDQVVKMHDEKYKKLLQSKSSPVKPAYEFQTKQPPRVSMRDSNSHEKSKTIEVDIATKEKQLETINSQIQRADEDLNLLQSKLTKYQKQVSEVEGKLVIRQKESKELAVQIETMANTKNGLKTDIDKFLIQKGEAQKGKTEIQRIVSDLKLQSDKLTQQRNLLEGQIKGLESRTRQTANSSMSVIQNSRTRTLEEKNKDLENKLAAAQNNEKKLNGDLQMSKEQLSDKEIHVSDLELKIKDLAAKLNESESKASTNDELKKAKDAISQLNSQITTKDKQIRKYQNDTIPNCQREIKSLKDQIAQYVDLENSYVKENQRINNQLLDVNEKMTKAEEEAHQKGKQLRQEEKRRKDIETENNQNLNKLRQAEKQLGELKKPNESSRVITLGADRLKYSQEIDALKNDLASKDRQLKQLQTDKESMRIKMHDLGKKLEDSKKGAVTTQTLQKKLTEMANENNRLQKMISDKEGLLQKQALEIERINKQKGANSGQLEAFDRERNELIAAIHEREAYINKLAQDLNKCNADIQTLVGFKDKLEKEKIDQGQNIKGLIETLNIRDVDIKYLTDENKNFKNRVAQLEKDLKSAIDKAKNESGRLESQQMRTAQRQISQLKSSKIKLETEKSNLERKITDLNNLNTRNNTPSYRQDALRKDLEKSRSDLRKIEEQRRELNSKNDKELQSLKTQLQQTESSLVKKDDEIQRVAAQLKQSEQSLAKKEKELQKLALQLQSLDAANKKMKEELLESQKKTQSISRLPNPANSRETLRITELEAKMKDYQKRIKEKEKEIVQMQDSLSSITIINNEYAQQVEDLEKKIENMRNQQNKSRIQTPTRNTVEIQRTADQLRAALSKSQALAKDVEYLQGEAKKMAAENQTLKDKLQKMQGQLNQSSQQVRTLSAQNTQIKGQLSKSTRQVQVLSNEKAHLEGEIKIHKQDVYRFKLKITSLQSQINQKIQQMRRLEPERSRIPISSVTSTMASDRFARNENVDEYKRKIHQLQSELETVKSRLTSTVTPFTPLPPAEGAACINCFFQGKVIDRELDHKRYLLEALQGHIRMRIVRTEMIYAFDSQNKVNFHKYVDGKEQIVLIIKLKNGSSLAAYSESGFIPKTPSSKDGLIMSLTNREIFKLAQTNRRAITYDDFYLIFGNSEIRIKSQDTSLFSNFAISNGYYNARGKRVDILMGGGPNERELQMQNYQIYQLSLKNE